MSKLKTLAFFLLVAAFIAALCRSTNRAAAPEPESPFSTARVLWVPEYEAKREQLDPGSEPGDYSIIDEPMRSIPIDRADRSRPD